MERQISTLYFERLLASRDKGSAMAEVAELIALLRAERFIKGPYVLDLKDYPALRETDLEQTLIDNVLIDFKIVKLTHGDVGEI